MTGDNEVSDAGRVPTELGSRKPSPDGLGPSGFDPSRDPGRRGELSIFDHPLPAVDVLADAMRVSPSFAREGLMALIHAGYVVAPRDPTTPMLIAYLESYQAPIRSGSAVTGIAKAARRWRAMGEKGTAMALSTRFLRERGPVVCPPCEDCGAEMVQTSHDTWECGQACIWSSGEAYRDSDGSGEAGETVGLDPKGDSAGPKDIAQGEVS